MSELITWILIFLCASTLLIALKASSNEIKQDKNLKRINKDYNLIPKKNKSY